MRSYLSLIPISAKVHKRQNRMTLLCIIIAVFLVTAVFSMADMAVRMEMERSKQKHGNWHIMLNDVPEETVQEILTRDDIELTSHYNTINYKINEDYYINGKRTAICGADSNITEIIGGFTEGRYPQNSHETVLTANSKTYFGIGIGDEITLNMPKGDKVYTVTGFNDDISKVMQYDSVVVFVNMEAFDEITREQTSDSAEYVTYIRFSDNTDIREAVSQVKEQYGLTDEQIGQNTAILGLLGYSDNPYVLGLYIVAAVLFVLILTAGVFMIAGSINTNVAERSRFFGMLRCTGASKAQIKSFVRLEALNWCKTAIPVGVILGIVITWGLCGILRIVSSEFSYIPVFGISVIGIVCGIIVGILTVLIAAQSPAKRAAKVSPVAAVSGSGENVKRVRHAANTKFTKIDTALGIHHAMSAKKNLFLMTGSFALSIILFLSFSIVVNWVHYALNPLRPYAPDFSVLSADRSCSVSRDFVGEISKITGVKNAFGRMYQNIPATVQDNSGSIDLISYEEKQFEWAKEDILDGDLSKVYGDSNYVITVFDKSNTLSVGDKIECEKGTVEVACVLSTSPFETTEIPTVITSEETFERLTGQKDYAVIDVQFTKDVTDESVNQIRRLAGEGFEFSDRRLSNAETKSTYWAFSLFVYGFLAVIALISIFNIINSISMSVSARIRQYGAMRAVGMDTKQISRMISAEAATYAASGCLVGCLIGLPLHMFLFDKMITNYFGDTWGFPIGALAVILVLMVLSSAAAVYKPAKRIKNMAVTDTINEL